jgi:hypothetical protein
VRRKGEEIMGTFNITYSDGTEKVETASDCDTVDQFINSRFGSSSGQDSIIVTLQGEPEAESEVKSKTKPKK